MSRLRLRAPRSIGRHASRVTIPLRLPLGHGRFILSLRRRTLCKGSSVQKSMTIDTVLTQGNQSVTMDARIYGMNNRLLSWKRATMLATMHLFLGRSGARLTDSPLPMCSLVAYYAEE